MLCFLAMTLCAEAGEPTTDYLYATGLQFDEEFELYYFDINLEGNNFYAAYGMDIQLPAGMKVVDDGETIYVLMNDPMYPQNKLTKKYTHSVTPSFPYPEDHSHLRVGCMSNPTKDLVATSGTLFRVYVTIDSDAAIWPIGTIKIFQAELVTKDAIGFNPTDRETVVPVHTGEITLPLNVSTAAQWSTCILPFSAEIPEGLKAYTCSNHDAEYIYLDETTALEAYMPYILYAENGYSGTISGTVSATNYPSAGIVTEGYLNGAIVPQTATEGYVLQKQEEGVKFYLIDEGDSFTIPAGKCWMNIPTGQVHALGFKTGGESDGINNIKISASSLNFDLHGRTYTEPLSQMRRANRSHGFFIKNGKKTLCL